MSDLDDKISKWRTELTQPGGISADEIAELESHLLQELDLLKKSGLQPDEAFFIASHRLGQPVELAAEYSKNQMLMCWSRPGRLVLWGLLTLQLMSLTWSFLMVGTMCLGSGRLLQWQATSAGKVIITVLEWATLVLFWSLATPSGGLIARCLQQFEQAIANGRNLHLVLGVQALVLANVALRLLASYLSIQVTHNIEASDPYYFMNFSFIAQLIFSQMVWTVPVAVLLAVLIRSDKHAIARLA
jgi:hypothetical protein